MFIQKRNPHILKHTPHHFSTEFTYDTDPITLATQFDIIIEPQLNNAIPRRKIEFIAGRYCASKAIQQTKSLTPKRVKINMDRSPQWPKGYVGSITHTQTFASAAVASMYHLRSIGIDSEKILERKDADQIAFLILSKEEMKRYKTQFSSYFLFEEFITLSLCAKESIYKCLNPIVHQFIDFHDLDIVDFDFSNNFFWIRLQKDLGCKLKRAREIKGSFECIDSMIHTAIELMHD
ncbi:MAG: 4'-phosphopantetheinyl transferase superfamily protein [Chlamydiota bacterium]|nr:4'-phosphopantetheinyl transferase superfamily protein [Chlamydiota bacterium]